MKDELETATKRLKQLRAKKTKYPAKPTIGEGWIDSQKNSIWDREKDCNVPLPDTYCWYARCGVFDLEQDATLDIAKDALVKHCTECSETKEGCWKPESSKTEKLEIILREDETIYPDERSVDTPVGPIDYDLGEKGKYVFSWMGWGCETQSKEYKTLSEARKVLEKHVESCKKCRAALNE